MSVLDQILARAAERKRRIVFPESDDPRTVAAVKRLARERIVEPVLLDFGGDRSTYPDQVEIVDPSSHAGHATCVRAVEEARQGRGDAAELIAEPLHYAAAFVRAGLADGTVSGATHTTAETLRAALRILKPAPETGVVSSFFLMQLAAPTESGDSVLAYADAGLVPEPDAEQLAEIARGTADQYRHLCAAEPRVALLSFSTKGSAEHESIDTIRRALEIVRSAQPDLEIDGELQGDAALVPAVGAAKAPGSSVAGRANVLIFPNLHAGNIAYKLTERLAGAQAIGPLLRGLDRPANDLSRGCGTDDIVVAAAVTALQAGSPYTGPDVTTSAPTPHRPP